MKKLVIFFSLIFVCLSLCSCENSVVINDFALDTDIRIKMDKKNEKEAKEAAELVKKYESVFSRTDENSEIYRLNNGQKITPSDETLEIIKEGIYYSKLSGGAFDITVEPLTSLWHFSKSPRVPTEEETKNALLNVGYEEISLEPFNLNNRRLDLGAIAKGYIGSKLRSFLKHDAIIDLGGNIILIGGPYKVGVQSPFDSSVFATMSVKDASVVTSGSYERYFEENGVKYHHILDTKTGYPVETSVVSVTVVTENDTQADAFSTIFFILGKEKAEKIAKDDIGFLFVYEDGSYYANSVMTDKYKLKINLDKQ